MRIFAFGGGKEPQFEPGVINSNPMFLQPSLQDGSEYKIELGGKECEFEPCGENGRVEVKNTNVESENEEVGKGKVKSGEKPEQEKKFSNHIEFVDYIPTHEVITYRHLFAYGFYIV